ncbi:MAG: FAD-dependent oxidoreductase, partial [Thermaerobacter sp.]|nr:FAD-dependent oxidoreductase [Thermaerobacter sp.]
MADVVVLGAGPAGLSCALFIAKAGRKVVVVDTNQTIIKRANLRNYLGFPEGLAGRELLVRGRAQVEQFGGTVINGRPVTVERSARGFVVRIGKELVKTTYMVLATGMSFQLAEQMGAEILRGNQVQPTRIVRTDPEGRTSLPGVWACGVV